MTAQDKRELDNLLAGIPGQRRQFEFRGNNLTIQSYLNPPRPAEWVLEGPSETGKTIASLNLLDAFARKYDGARLVIVRQYHVDLASTVLDTFKREFVDPAGDVRIFGGEFPLFYEYPNGSRIWTAGLDRPGKVLSGNLDGIYFNQAEEATQVGWETLTTRVTGRGGVIVPGLLFGDMNPASTMHWLYSRELAGTVKILQTSHRDNPNLFDDHGNLTEQGRETIGRLSKLTGVLKARLFEGTRANAEGLVYGDVWSTENVTEQADYTPDGGSIFWAIDDGYAGELDERTHQYTAQSHPRVFLLCQLRPDGILKVFAESYAVKKLADEHIKDVQALPYPAPDYAAVDKSAAELIGRLNRAGIYTRRSPASVDESIKLLREWIGADTNGVRKFIVHPRVRHLLGELASYQTDKETQKPIKAFDHGPDAARYIVWTLRHNS